MLRAARETRGLSQQAVATTRKTDRSNYARIEAGRANVTVDTLLAVARALGSELSIAVQPSAAALDPASDAAGEREHAPADGPVGDTEAAVSTRGRR